jgi:hypothetical protein
MKPMRFVEVDHRYPWRNSTTKVVDVDGQERLGIVQDGESYPSILQRREKVLLVAHEV